MASGIRTLFSPAIRLMNRLNYPRKFAVLGSMVGSSQKTENKAR